MEIIVIIDADDKEQAEACKRRLYDLFAGHDPISILLTRLCADEAHIIFKVNDEPYDDERILRVKFKEGIKCK